MGIALNGYNADPHTMAPDYTTGSSTNAPHFGTHTKLNITLTPTQPRCLKKDKARRFRPYLE